MPYENAWNDKGVIRTYHGDITSHEILNSNASIQTDPRFSEIKYIINDFTDINSCEAYAEDIDAIAAIDYGSSQARNIPNKIAIVARNETLLNWAHIYCEKMKNSPYIFMICDTADEACQWVAETIQLKQED